jgi:hypothetical protein
VPFGIVTGMTPFWEGHMSAGRAAIRIIRENWLIILAILVNVAIAGPLAADWKSDVCVVNGRVVECCTDCSFFCSCGDSPAP